MLDNRATHYGLLPSQVLGLDARSPVLADAWAALLVNEACYLAGGRQEAEIADAAAHNEVMVFPTRPLRLRR